MTLHSGEEKRSVSTLLETETMGKDKRYYQRQLAHAHILIQSDINTFKSFTSIPVTASERNHRGLFVLYIRRQNH